MMGLEACWRVRKGVRRNRVQMKMGEGQRCKSGRRQRKEGENSVRM